MGTFADGLEHLERPQRLDEVLMTILPVAMFIFFLGVAIWQEFR